MCRLHSGGCPADTAPAGGREEQCSEVWCLADNAARGVHSTELCRKGKACEATMQAVLSPPGRTLVIETETVSTPGMTDEVMNCTKPIKCATERAVE